MYFAISLKGFYKNVKEIKDFNYTTKKGMNFIIITISSFSLDLILTNDALN